MIDYIKINQTRYPAVYFHDVDKEHGFLSNWYPSAFEVDGMEFSCMEQYLMFRKCLFSGDVITAEDILATDDPAEQKKLGRGAEDYNDTVWSGIRQSVAMRGLLAKFSQNKTLKQQLLDTEEAVLVECAAGDMVWACGIAMDSADKTDISKWKGSSILGFALMEVRSMLMEEKDPINQ